MPDALNVVSIVGKQLEIRVGTEVFVPCRNRGGHGAWVVVTKVNKRSFKGVEAKGSYIAGMQWSVHVDATYAVVERPEGQGWKKHWVNDL